MRGRGGSRPAPAQWRSLPLGVAFFCQMLVTCACVSLIVALFVVAHQRATDAAARDVVSSSLNYCRENMAEPFLEVVPLLRTTALRFESMQIWCDTEWSPEKHVPIMEQFLPIQHVLQERVMYTYQQNRHRLKNDIDPANATLHDYWWMDCGCANDSCFYPTAGEDFEYSRLRNAYPNASQNNEVFERVYDNPNLTLSDYMERAKKMTSLDKAGVWGPPEIEMVTWDDLLYPSITFVVPVRFDDSGDATSVISLDFNLVWMRQALLDMRLPSTELTVFDPYTMWLAATTFDFPTINVPNMSEPTVGDMWRALETPSETLTESLAAIIERCPNKSITQLNETLVLLDVGGYIVGAQPLHEETLHLVVLTVTKRELYMAEGERVQLTSVLVGVAGIALCTVTCVAVWRWISRPLRLMAADIQACANLQVTDHVAGDDSRIREVQVISIAATKMATRLQEYKKFLPYTMQIGGTDLRSSEPFVEQAPPGLSEDGTVQEEPTVAIVFTDLVSSTALWLAEAEGMSEGLVRHNLVLRQAITEWGGYEVKTIGDSFMVAFEDAQAAIEFGLCVQCRMPEADWPNRLREVTDEGPWSGLRLRVGMSCGPVRCEQNVLTGRMDYFGTTVNVAARLESVSPASCMAVLRSDEDLVSGTIKVRMDATVLRGCGRHNVTALLPSNLAKRLDDIRLAVKGTPVRYSKLLRTPPETLNPLQTRRGRGAGGPNDDATVDFGSVLGGPGGAPSLMSTSLCMTTSMVCPPVSKLTGATAVKALFVDDSSPQDSVDVPRVLFSVLSMCLGRTEGTVTGVSGCSVSMGWGFVWPAAQHRQNAFRFMSMLSGSVSQSTSELTRAVFGSSTGTVRRKSVGDGVRFVSYVGACVALCDELCPGLAGTLQANCLYALPGGGMLPDDFDAARPVLDVRFLQEDVTVMELDLARLQAKDTPFPEASAAETPWTWSREYRRVFREKRRAELRERLSDPSARDGTLEIACSRLGEVTMLTTN